MWIQWFWFGSVLTYQESSAQEPDRINNLKQSGLQPNQLDLVANKSFLSFDSYLRADDSLGQGSQMYILTHR